MSIIHKQVPLVLLFAFVSCFFLVNGVSAQAQWVTIESQDFGNTDANRWSGGSISDGVYTVTGTGAYTLTKTLPNNIAMRVSLVATDSASSGITHDIYVYFKSDTAGTIQLHYYRGNGGTRTATVSNYYIPYEYTGGNSRIEIYSTAFGNSHTTTADNFVLEIWAEPITAFDFSTSAQGDWWSGGSVSGGTYTSSVLTALNFSSRYFYSQNQYIIVGKVSGSFTASASRTVTASIGSTQIYTGTGTSLSFSNYIQYGYATGSIPTFTTTQSGALTAQTFTVDDVKIVRITNPTFIVQLCDENTKALYYNSSLAYTYYAYDSTGSATAYTLPASVNEFSVALPSEAMVLVSAGSTSYSRRLISPSTTQDFYLAPIGSVMPVTITIVDYTGLWGALQHTKVSLYDQSNTYLITDAWVDVGYKVFIYPTYLGQYYMVITSDYATYTSGLYYALTAETEVAINFAPSGFSTSVNATRLDHDTIRVHYYDPQALTFNVTLIVSDVFDNLIYQGTTTNAISTWEIDGCASTVPIEVNVSAWIQTNQGVTNKEWVIVLPINATSSSDLYENSTTPISPPFSLGLEIAGFPVLGGFALLVLLFLEFQFPSPYLRYAVLLMGGFAFFFAYSNWLPAIPSLGWSAIGVVCVIYALTMKRRR